MFIAKGGAPSGEHERIRGLLDLWSAGLFPRSSKGLGDGMRPDVTRVDEDGTGIFVGDAKCSEHEGPENNQTVNRISGYVEEVSELLKEQSFALAMLAIATNNEAAATKWRSVLGFIAVTHDLKPTEGVVRYLGDSVWVAAVPVVTAAR